MSRVVLNAKRVLTGILSAAMIFTAVPSYVFAAEAGDENAVAESVITDETAEETEVLPAVDAQAAADALPDGSDALPEGSEEIDTASDADIADDNDNASPGEVGESEEDQLLAEDATDDETADVTGDETVDVDAAAAEEDELLDNPEAPDGECVITLNDSSHFNSAVFYEYDENNNRVSGPTDVYKGLTEFGFHSGNRIVITGLGQKTEAASDNDLIRVTAGENVFYGDSKTDENGVLFDLGILTSDTDVKLETAPVVIKLDYDSHFKSAVFCAYDENNKVVNGPADVKKGVTAGFGFFPDNKIVITGLGAKTDKASKMDLICLTAGNITMYGDSILDDDHVLFDLGNLSEKTEVKLTTAPFAITLNKSSHFKSAVFTVYDEKGNVVNGPADVKKDDTATKLAFFRGNRIAVTGLGERIDNVSAVDFFKVTAGGKVYYGDNIVDSAGELFDLGVRSASIDVKIETSPYTVVYKEDDRLKYTINNTVFNEDENKYFFKPKVTEFTFTVKSGIDKVPIVKICDGISSENWDNGTEVKGSLTTDKNYTERTYTYKISAEAAAGKYLFIKDEPAVSKKVTVSYNPDQVKEPELTTSAGNAKRGTAYSDGTIMSVPYNVPEFATVTVKTSPLSEYYKLTGKGTLSFVAKEDSDVRFVSEPITTIFIGDENDWEKAADKARFSLTRFQTTKIKVCDGDPSKSSVDVTVMAKAGSKDITGSFVKNESGIITVDAKGAQELGNSNTVTLTIKGKFDGKNNSTRTLTFVVEQNPQTVSLKGFKNTQNAGTEVKYQMTVDPKTATIDDIDFVLAGDGKDGVQASMETDAKGNRFLKVCTFNGKKIPSAPFNIQFVDKKDNNRNVGSAFVFEPKQPKLAAPSVRFAEATDIDAKLTIYEPNGLQNYKNLYYEVKAKCSNGPGLNMKASVEEHIAYTPGTKTLQLKLADEFEYGKGRKQWYDIEVNVIQIKDDSIAERDKFASENVFASGTKKNARGVTNDPCYETKLGLNKVNASFFCGQQGPITLATGKYSTKTSYRTLGVAEIKGDKGLLFSTDKTPRIICLSDDKQSVQVVDSSKFEPGKYTLSLYPDPYDGYSTPATLAVTVNAAVTDISIDKEQLPNTIYKKAGAIARVPLDATALSYFYVDGENHQYKPFNKRINWNVESDNPDLLAAVSVKNGKLIVNGNYAPVNGTVNTFTLTATPADGINPDVNEKVTFAVAGSYVDIAGFSIGNITDFSNDVLSTDIDGKEFKVFDSNKNPLSSEDLKNVSITVEPKDGLAFFSGGGGAVSTSLLVTVKKAGTYNIKVNAKDGGKKSFTQKIKIKNDDVKEYKTKCFLPSYEMNEENLFITKSKDSFENKKDIDLITVRVQAVPKHDNAYCKNGAKVLAVNGSIIVTQQAYDDNGFPLPNTLDYIIKPKSGKKITITVKGDNNKDILETYVINNDEGTVESKMRKSHRIIANVAESVNQTVSLEFPLKGFNFDGYNEHYKFKFTNMESEYKKSTDFNKTKHLIDKLNADGSKFAWDKKSAVATWTVSGLTGLERGKPVAYVTLYKVDDTGKEIEALTKGQIITTFDVHDATKPMAAVLRYVDSPGTDILDYEKNKTNINEILKIVPIKTYSNNKNGSVNKFAYFFEAVSDNNGKMVMKIKNNTSGFDSLDSKDQIGWIKYRVYGLDGVTYIENTEKITINEDKFVETE